NAQHARENLLTDHQRIGHHFERAQTNVARIARPITPFLAEVFDQTGVPALNRSGVPVDFIQRSRGCAACIFGHAFDQFLPGDYVATRIEQPTFGLDAIPAGPPALLLVVFHRLGHSRVNDVAYVRFVDTHAEGNRG